MVSVRDQTERARYVPGTAEVSASPGGHNVTALFAEGADWPEVAPIHLH